MVHVSFKKVPSFSVFTLNYNWILGVTERKNADIQWKYNFEIFEAFQTSIMHPFKKLVILKVMNKFYALISVVKLLKLILPMF